jgi:hypothetical protein
MLPRKLLRAIFISYIMLIIMSILITAAIAEMYEAIS